MGRVSLDDLDKYNSGGNGGRTKWFKLEDDKDTAQVRIMLEEPDDLNDYIYVTHKIKVGEKAKYPNTHINCLRSYNDPISDCPFCSDNMSASVRVFLPVFNIDAGEVQFFDRPRSIVGKIQGLMGRYKDFPSHIFEIERNGEKGDKGTTYEFYEVDDDDTTLEDLPEIPDVIGSAVLDKSFEEMEHFIEEGSFDSDEDKAVRRRRPDTRSRRRDEEEEDDIPFEQDEEEEERPRRRSEERRTSTNRDRTRRRRSSDEEF